MSALVGVVRRTEERTRFSSSTLGADLSGAACKICTRGFSSAMHVWQCNQSMCKTTCHISCMFDRVALRTFNCPGKCGFPVGMDDCDRIIAVRVQDQQATIESHKETIKNQSDVIEELVVKNFKL